VPIVRFEPGDEAPRAGTYALTGEWGEPAGESALVALGERLPLADTATGPRWYVLLAVDGATGGPDIVTGPVKARRLEPTRSGRPGRFQHSGHARV
jgi:hypothetical protein